MSRKRMYGVFIYNNVILNVQITVYNNIHTIYIIHILQMLLLATRIIINRSITQYTKCKKNEK